ncbi:MAG: PTS sugar transporter subunit IIA [Kiritimatiellaeota bacterium]|nr:PTS sugar transporter subunit IIA [Kiritimatiellota bacterium]
MKTLLAALEEGRLIELPENSKDQALQILGSLIEAIPGLKAGTQVVESVLARERAASTALGLGWACPHARTTAEGELLCAIGWSPAGIAYGAPDGRPVRLVVMYYIPDAQKNAYLKEISALARVIHKPEGLQPLDQAPDLNTVRIRLLDIISAAMETDVPEARARMIRLEAKQAAVAAGVTWPAQIAPCALLVRTGQALIVLALDRDVVAQLEAAADLPALLAKQGQADVAGYRVLLRHAVAYQPDRVLYDCLALKLPHNPATSAALPPPVAGTSPPT